MVRFYNPALEEESRNEPARIIPLKERESLLNWLERTDRLFKTHKTDKSHEDVELKELEDIIASSISDFDN